MNIRSGIRSASRDTVGIWIIMFVLGFIGLLSVYSSTERISGAAPAAYLARQFLFLVVGFGMCYAISKMPLALFRGTSVMCFWGITILWWVMQVWAWYSGGSSPRIVQLPYIGSFQPAEFAKIAVVMYIAYALAFNQADIRKFKTIMVKFVLPLTCIGLPIFFSNFSTLAIICLTSAGLMWLGNVRLRHLLLITAIIAVALWLGMFLAHITIEHNETMRRHKDKPTAFWYRAERLVKRTRLATMDSRWREFKERLLSEKKTERDFEQIDYAWLAIASSSILPTLGPGNSEVKYMLPEAFSDFIFAIIVEEYGVLLASVFVLLILFVILPWRIGVFAKRSSNYYATLLIIGLCLQITLQTLAHVGVSVEFFPVTGQNLPLISHGGSSVISTCIMFGLILNVMNHIIVAERKAAAAATAAPDPVGDDAPSFNS